MDNINQKNLLHYYQSVREKTLQLCEPLAIEDYVIQSMEDVSPPKWHLAHTTWFFEIFILMPYLPNYKPFQLEFLKRFNSYYHTIDNPYPRGKRGLLSRPTLKTIHAYRKYVDEHIMQWLSESKTPKASALQTLRLGLHHEQQHQELLLMDIKHNFFMDPERPSYFKKIQKTKTQAQTPSLAPLEYIEMQGGIIEIGHKGKDFCFDNELPRHPMYLLPFAMANRLISNGEYLEFIRAGGYQNPEFWLSEGWDAVQKYQWKAPLYWQAVSVSEWSLFSLYGQEDLNLKEPVSHISFFEADAFARWQHARLPSEFEWEHFVNSSQEPIFGNFLEQNHCHPQTPASLTTRQLYGDLWEWTASAYSPFPGYLPVEGALGEYNGKFMCNQFVLRGGSCATPLTHIRSSYRNYYSPDKRWQFSGIRLARI